MTNEVLEGDALTIQKTLPDKIVQTCITSIPYWGLRSYGTEPQIWGGREDCEHKWGNPLRRAAGNRDVGFNERWGNSPGDKKQEQKNVGTLQQGSFCRLCNAWRGELGLEPTPELYVEHVVSIFRETRRVLRDDGTLWLNMGDSYVGGGRGGGFPESTYGRNNLKPSPIPKNLKPKDLCGIPWKVAFALQADGWWLRSDTIWSKPNPMPESVTDRPTRSHEYIFLLTKSGSLQYWTHRDLNGTRKKPKADWRWVNQINKTEIDYPPDDWKKIIACPICDATGKVVIWDGIFEWPDKCPVCKGERETQLWKRINLWRGHDYLYDADAVREPHTESSINRAKYERFAEGSPKMIKGQPIGKNRIDGGLIASMGLNDLPMQLHSAGRNLRSVWTFATQPFPEAHFATFPEELVRRCILAGTAEQACPKCGSAWERVTESKQIKLQDTNNPGKQDLVTNWDRNNWPRTRKISETLKFRPTCDCPGNDGSGRCIALDPFGGSGTVPLVALKHGRDHITIELKPEYIKMIEKRLKPLGNKPCPQQIEIR